MKTDMRKSYKEVEASIKLHLYFCNIETILSTICIQILFILGLVIVDLICPNLEEFKTSIFIIIIGAVILTIVFNIAFTKWFLYYLRQQLELPVSIRNHMINRYIVKGYLDFSFAIPFWILTSIFCYNMGCFLPNPVITMLIILVPTVVIYFVSKDGAIEEDVLLLLTMN